VYAPTPANPSPTKNAPDIAKSIFQRIFIALDFSCALGLGGSARSCGTEILQPAGAISSVAQDGYRLGRDGHRHAYLMACYNFAYVFVPASELKRVSAILGAP
jgi:hypothetical protein